MNGGVIDCSRTYAAQVGGKRQFATFYIGGLFFGIDVLRVQEILCPQRMTPVPLAEEIVEGLINLRGQIVSAIDMRRRLNMECRKPDGESMNIVIHTDEGAVSLLVDEIGDVVEVDETTFEAPPENLTSNAKKLVSGVYKMRERLLLVIDTDRTLDLDINETNQKRTA